MPIGKIVERAERHLGRIHLAVWIVEVLTSASLGGFSAYASGLPLPLVALAALGGVVAVTVAIILCYDAWVWLSRFVRRRFEAHGISIVLGTASPFETYKASLHQRYHLIKVGLVNTSQSRALTNCRVQLENITGSLAHKCPVTIREGFILNPGASEYIELVGLNESGSEVAYDSSGRKYGIRAYFPINPLPSDKSSWLDDQPYTLTLLATAAESPPYRLTCRIYVENGGLKLETT
jgi:hypothetical protein